jgi:hypothetical protein
LYVNPELGTSQYPSGGHRASGFTCTRWTLITTTTTTTTTTTIDNLFVTNNFCEVMYDRGYGVTGTCRTNSGVISELVKMKKGDKGRGEMPWGEVHTFPSPSGKVMHVGFKNLAFALAMSTVFDSSERITILRKRPTGAPARAARKAFADQATAKKEIPELYHEYNNNMGAVDVGDQLGGYMRMMMIMMIIMIIVIYVRESSLKGDILSTSLKGMRTC